ncbi:DNA-binding response regulator, LuxR family [alpha proteobacterium U9-1i]|nr:DNA-binding response regulator, LuxR family [alpha proteobacterium U9-1i]
MALEKLISIIDDDDSLRVALVGLVRSLGYRASGFSSAEEFLAAGGGAGSACVVTDIQMPGLSGIELKQRLVEGGCHAPVIMITARNEADLHERARASGAHCVLKKPFAPDALIDCLERALAS